MDIDLCKRIQCGAVSQQEAGLDVLLECSQAGLVGVKGCGHPDCAPYYDAMRSRGICPPAYEVPAEAAPVPAAAAPPPLPILTATLPSITPRPPQPAPVEAQTYSEPWYCAVNRWADRNPVPAVLVLAGVYILVAGWRRTV